MQSMHSNNLNARKPLKYTSGIRIRSNALPKAPRVVAPNPGAVVVLEALLLARKQRGRHAAGAPIGPCHRPNPGSLLVAIPTTGEIKMIQWLIHSVCTIGGTRLVKLYLCTLRSSTMKHSTLKRHPSAAGSPAHPVPSFAMPAVAETASAKASILGPR